MRAYGPQAVLCAVCLWGEAACVHRMAWGCTALEQHACSGAVRMVCMHGGMRAWRHAACGMQGTHTHTPPAVAMSACQVAGRGLGSRANKDHGVMVSQGWGAEAGQGVASRPSAARTQRMHSHDTGHTRSGPFSLSLCTASRRLNAPHTSLTHVTHTHTCHTLQGGCCPWARGARPRPSAMPAVTVAVVVAGQGQVAGQRPHHHHHHCHHCHLGKWSCMGGLGSRLQQCKPPCKPPCKPLCQRGASAGGRHRRRFAVCVQPGVAEGRWRERKGRQWLGCMACMGLLGRMGCAAQHALCPVGACMLNPQHHMHLTTCRVTTGGRAVWRRLRPWHMA
jgi:hypothetical protein